MRHVLILREGLEGSQAVQIKIRSAPTPYDKNILSYYKFDKDWQNHDSFYYTSIESKGFNILITNSSEPE